MRRSSDRSPSERALDVGERRASRTRMWSDEAAALGEYGLVGRERTRPSGEGRTVGCLLQSEGGRIKSRQIRTIQWIESGPLTYCKGQPEVGGRNAAPWETTTAAKHRGEAWIEDK